MPSDTLGAEFLRRLANGEGVTGKITDFTGASLQNAELSGLDLMGVHLREANLSGARLERSNLTSAKLERANLDNTKLMGATLNGADLRDCNLKGSNLTGAMLGNAQLDRARMNWCVLTDVDLQEAYLYGACLLGSEGRPYDRRGVHIDAATYKASEWTPAHLTEWIREGAILKDFTELPPEAQDAVLQEREGLTLYFYGSLEPFDRMVIETVILEFRRTLSQSDVRMVGYNHERETTTIRLRASNSADLVLLAVELYQRRWEKMADDAHVLTHLRAPSPALTSDLLLHRLSWLLDRGDRFELWEMDAGTLKQTHTWRVELTREKVLTDLLLNLFDGPGLRSFIGLGLGKDVAADLLEGGTLREQASHATDVLTRHGLLDRTFFLHLMRERPGQLGDIRFAAQMYNLTELTSSIPAPPALSQ